MLSKSQEQFALVQSAVEAAGETLQGRELRVEEELESGVPHEAVAAFILEDIALTNTCCNCGGDLRQGRHFIAKRGWVSVYYACEGE